MVIPDISERVCTGYISLMRAQAGDYRDRPNALLTDRHLRYRYFDIYQRRVGDDGQPFTWGMLVEARRAGVAPLALTMEAMLLLFRRRQLLLSLYICS